jgi:hypothetical protein
MALRFLSGLAEQHSRLVYLFGVCLLLQPACHGKGQNHAGSQTGSCLGVPNTPAGTDLVYPVYGADVAPGSASHPLPITRLLVTAPGYGHAEGFSSDDNVGAVFSIPLGTCPN